MLQLITYTNQKNYIKNTTQLIHTNSNTQLLNVVKHNPKPIILQNPNTKTLKMNGKIKNTILIVKLILFISYLHICLRQSLIPNKNKLVKLSVKKYKKTWNQYLVIYILIKLT